MSRRFRIFLIALVAAGALVLLALRVDLVIPGRILEEGKSSQISDRSVRVIHSQAEMESFWSDHAGDEDHPPAIDFSRGVVVAAMHGFHSNLCVANPTFYSIGGLVLVRFDDLEWATGCFSAVATPFKLLYVPGFRDAKVLTI